jgi:CRP-like cAMP-binding protein
LVLARNNLLGVLSQKDHKILEPHLRKVHAAKGTVLHEQGVNVNFAYFPCGASLVAFKVLLPDGREIDAALIGREGAIGGIVSAGYLPAYARASVEFPGDFWKIDVGELESAKLRSTPLSNLLARYSDCLLAQLFQSTACNASHPIEQRTAKWLLTAMDRTGTPEIPWTHEQLGNMLGIGRSYMSRILQKFKAEGVLETRRGRLYVRNAGRLHHLGCGCRDAVCHHFEAVLQGVYPFSAIH